MSVSNLRQKQDELHLLELNVEIII